MLGASVARCIPAYQSGQHQRRGEGVGGEQEPALEEQDAVSQEKGQDGAPQIGAPHLPENQDHGHTHQEGGQRRGHHLPALLEEHPRRQSGRPASVPVSTVTATL